MSNRQFFIDSERESLTYQNATVDADFSPQDAETVVLDSPWNTFFNTDKYVEFEATVAQPIVQSYFYDGELQQFRKDEDELKQAQAQIESLPWTIDHPPKKRVTEADQIRGFFADPTYNDGQEATLYVPANDTDAVRYAVTNDATSIGFSGELEWVDDEDVDAVQRDMVYDHIASVESGRCSPQDGCSITTDDIDSHGHVISTVEPLGLDDQNGMVDAVQTTTTEEEQMEDAMNPSYSVDEWVSWNWSGGTAIGQIKSVHTDGPVSVDGTERDPSEEGEPVYKINHWNEQQGEFGNTKIAYESNLSDASDPRETETTTDNSCTECSYGSCSCGRHVALTIDAVVDAEDIGDLDLTPPQSAQEAAQTALDYREDTDAMTSTGWDRAEQLAAGEELDPADISDGTDGMANWWARHESHTVSGDSLKREKSDSEDREYVPYSDDNSWIAGKGWGGIAGMNWAMRMDKKITELRATNDALDLPSFTEGDVVEHQYLDVTGVVAHNPDGPYVMVDPMVDGERTERTMTFGVGDLLLVERRLMGGEMMEDNDSDAVIQLTDESTIQDTITFDGLMNGDLDESAIPNEGYEPHYVFDSDTKSDSSYPLVDADGNLRRGNVKAAWELYGRAEDEQFLLDVLEQANQRFANADGMSAPIPEDSLTEAMTDGFTDMTIQEFIDDNDLSTEDVIDQLEIDPPDCPTDFYDSEPDVATLADDFTAVEALVDSKESLEDDVETLNDELHEYRVEQFKDSAERLAELVESRDVDSMVEQFNDGELTIDDVDDQIEVAEEAIGSTTTTVNTDSEVETDSDLVADNTGQVTDSELDRTQGGRYNLSSHDI